ncbi:hypothetical protein PRUPE_3G207800 [Prunus persica]|uniref:Mitochondrial pyruvate carrier n=1 Tax=Prunus persica TaxID=3760 RepID=A0A251Q385_PRUPE|nr:hypothetical protein PRUPE_3G207800 [Prunus persica]
MANSKLQAFWNHPAGPKTILACSGLIWARYGTVITPKNWNLASVNFGMSLTALFQLSRKIQHDLSAKTQEADAEEE